MTTRQTCLPPALFPYGAKMAQWPDLTLAPRARKDASAVSGPFRRSLWVDGLQDNGWTLARIREGPRLRRSGGFISEEGPPTIPDASQAVMARAAATLERHSGTQVWNLRLQVPSDNQGMEILHEGLLVTLFSASNYAGHQGNQVCSLGGAAWVCDSPVVSVVLVCRERRAARQKLNGACFLRDRPIHSLASQPLAVAARGKCFMAPTGVNIPAFKCKIV